MWQFTEAYRRPTDAIYLFSNECVEELPFCRILKKHINAAARKKEAHIGLLIIYYRIMIIECVCYYNLQKGQCPDKGWHWFKL